MIIVQQVSRFTLHLRQHRQDKLVLILTEIKQGNALIIINTFSSHDINFKLHNIFSSLFRGK